MMVEDCYVHYRLDNANNSTNSNKKIFCVCDEIGEIFDFIRERPDRRDLVKVANKLRTKTYNWNLRRIAPESRHIFIDRWHEESRLLHENGELDFSLLKFKEKVREWLILFYPQFFEKKFDV